MIFSDITHQFFSTPPLEWIAFFFGVAQVVLAWKNKVANFYVGAISVMLYTYLFYENGLYAEALLNAYYLAISLGGIFMWQKRKSHQVLAIRSCTRKNHLHSFLLFVSTFLLLLLVLIQFTNSTVPIADALVSSLAWTGAYLLAQRKLENWLWLTASNIIAIPLLVYKGMPLTALLTVIYLVLGVLGYFNWKSKRDIEIT